MRAADAAKNTAELIESTVDKVGTGSQIVTKTNATFEEVAGSVAKVADLVAEIAAASNEQTEGVGQVNTAVAEMDKVVQQNAATAEESASAAEELSAQAEQMTQIVTDLMAMVGGQRNKTEDGKATLAEMSSTAQSFAAALTTRVVGGHTDKTSSLSGNPWGNDGDSIKAF